MHPSFFPVSLQGREVGTAFTWTEQDLHKSLACQPVLAGSLHYWKCFNGQLASNIYSHLVIYCKSPRVISDSTFSPFDLLLPSFCVSPNLNSLSCSHFPCWLSSSVIDRHLSGCQDNTMTTVMEFIRHGDHMNGEVWTWWTSCLLALYRWGK